MAKLPQFAPYDYLVAGFSPFLTRSIDEGGATTLQQSVDLGASYGNRSVNWDQTAVTGQLGDIMQIGNIQIDGSSGRISIYDENGNEVVRIGAL